MACPGTWAVRYRASKNHRGSSLLSFPTVASREEGQRELAISMYSVDAFCQAVYPIFQALYSLALMMNLQGFKNPHFKDEKVKPQRG